MKTYSCFMAVFVATAVLFAYPGYSQAADKKVYTLRYQHSYPPTLAFYQNTGQGFIKLVEKWSDGRIKFKEYNAGALTSVANQLEAVDQGIIDVSQSWGGFYTGDVPEANIEIGLPLAWQEPWEVYDAYYNRGLLKVISKAYESRYNVKYFPAITGFRYGISSTKPINSLADLKGLKIRATGIYGELLQKLGASAVVMPGAELYTGLQLGTIDGLVYGFQATVAQSLQPLLKSAIISPNLNSGCGNWLINRDTWSKLPKDLQEVISRAVRYGNAAHAMEYASISAESAGRLRRAGVHLVTLNKADQKELQDVALGLWDEVVRRSKLAKQGVEIVKQQQKDYGQLSQE